MRIRDPVILRNTVISQPNTYQSLILKRMSNTFPNHRQPPIAGTVSRLVVAAVHKLHSASPSCTQDTRRAGNALRHTESRTNDAPEPNTCCSRSRASRSVGGCAMLRNVKNPDVLVVHTHTHIYDRNAHIGFMNTRLRSSQVIIS